MDSGKRGEYITLVIVLLFLFSILTFYQGKVLIISSDFMLGTGHVFKLTDSLIENAKTYNPLLTIIDKEEPKEEPVVITKEEETLYSPLTSQNTYISILNPYQDQIILAQSDFTQGADYTWRLNNEIVETDKTHTTFLAHFDNNLSSSDGEQPLSSVNPIFEEGKFEEGLSGKSTYSTTNNLNVDEGTVEFWLTLKKPITDVVFNSSTGDPNFLMHDQSFRFSINNVQTQIGFIAYEGDWNNSAQLNTGSRTVDVNQPIHFAFTYSKSNNNSDAYMNGFKIGSGRYDFNFPLSSSFTIGNPNAVIDEFRVYNKVLSVEEIRFDYTRGITFSDNDIYFNKTLAKGNTILISMNEGFVSDQKQILGKKINVTSPHGFIINNTDEINFNFKTSSSLICAYGEHPDLYSELTSLESSSTTTHTLTIPVTSTLDYYPVYIKCGSDDYAVYERIRVLPEINNNFPKLSTLVWGNNINVSEEEKLEFYSRFDSLSISKSNQVQPNTLRQIRELNPDIIILPYVMAIGYQNFTNNYPFSDLIDRLTPNMYLTDLTGAPTANPSFPNNVIGNLYTENNFSETLSYHTSEEMIQEGIWDGIWYDVVGSSLWFLVDFRTGNYVIQPDFDMDSIEEDLDNSADLTKATQIWIDGMDKLMELTREKSGNDMIIVGNGVDYNHNNYNGNLWERKLEWWEGAGDDNGALETFMRYNATYSSRSFPYFQEQTKAPHFNSNLFMNNYNSTTNPTEHYKRHRLGFTASIISEIYYDPEIAVGSSADLLWYDEYMVNIYTSKPTNNTLVDSGYLGEPISTTTEFETLAWKKEFENGIVYLNGKDTSLTIQLDKIYRYVNGTQDSTINKGGLTTNSITLQANDGIILLRALCSNNPSSDPNCIALCGDSVCSANETCSSCSQDCGTCSNDDNGDNGDTGDDSGDSTTSSGSSYCGDNRCNSNENCNTCTRDCGSCSSEDSNTIYLIPGVNNFIQTSGGEYDLVINDKHYTITIQNINQNTLDIVYNDDVRTINFNGYVLFTLDDQPLKLIYSSNTNNQAGLILVLEKIPVYGTYNPYEFTYFWIYFIIYLVVILLFIIFRKHKGHI
nr:hypothetical protein [Nanoarchaeum sp.]